MLHGRMKRVVCVNKEQWDAVKNRDKNYDGKFVYGLKTTKKYCRPSCPKRSYDPRRIVIFDTVQEAVSSGYRPCSRCHPDIPGWIDAKTELSRSVKAYIQEHYTEAFSLSSLANAAHVDKAYLARCFKSVTGSTPLEYYNVVRCERAKELLIRPELSISYIAAAVGYVSASHFSRVFKKRLGCTPSEYRNSYFLLLESEDS